MGREVKRVPLDFNQPLNETWPGYLSPNWRACPGEDCVNGCTAAAEWIGSIVHLLLMVGEAGISDRPLHPWLQALPLAPRKRPGRDAAEFSGGLAGRAPRGAFGGHDAIDRWSATAKVIQAAGLPKDWGTCKTCAGSGLHPDDRAASEAWTRTDPPEGEGWQLWETVSEGSPISPVFSTAEGLAAWMSDPARGRDWLPPQTAAGFIAKGWAPTFVGSAGTGVVSGAEFIGFHNTGES